LVYPIDSRKKWKMSRPEQVFKIGAVRASIFRNSIEVKGRQILMPKVVLEVRYRDKSGTWKGTNSLGLGDIPKAILALQKAYEYLLEHKENVNESDASEEDVASPQKDLKGPVSSPFWR
jgi:hypothetical protein